MKIIKDIIAKSVIKKWRVASKSRIGIFNEVSLLNINFYKCTCMANRMGVLCSHIKMIKYNNGEVENKVFKQKRIQ